MFLPVLLPRIPKMPIAPTDYISYVWIAQTILYEPKHVLR